MKTIFISLMLIMASAVMIYAQPAVNVGTVTGAQGQVVTVPVTVSGCDATNSGTGVTGMEIHITYTDAVQYFGITNLYSGFSAGDWTFNGTGTQFIGLWSSPTFLPYDLPDGTVLFEIQFIARNGGTSPLQFLNVGSQTILLDASFEVIAGTSWNNGSVTMPAPAATTSWNSSASQSWTTVSNWSNGLPGLTSNVTVASGTMLIDNANFLCNNLAINAGAALTINSGITVSIPGNLILDSDASHTRTGSLINNGTLNVAGQRIVKRWLEGGMNHFISTPLRLGTTVNTIYNPSNPGWAYSWDETTASWNNLFELTTPIQIGYGYVVNYTDNEMLDFSITDNPGFNMANSYNPNTSYTNGNGWILVGNPYLASLNWLGSGWTKSKIDNGIYFYNGTTYASFVGGVGTNGGTQYIPAMQGFFIHANGSGPNFVMPRASLVHNAQPYYKNTINDLLRIRISGNGHEDEAVVRFIAEAGNGFDTELDAYKLMSMNDEVPQVYTVASDMDLSINSQPELLTSVVVPVKTLTAQPGAFSLNVEGTDSFASDVNILLEDKSTGGLTDLRMNAQYSFEAGSGVSERFVLHFTKSTGLGDDINTQGSVYVSGNTIFIRDVEGKASVYALTGQLIQSTDLSSGTLNNIQMSNVPAGIYLVKVQSAQGSFATKVHIK